MPPQIFNSFLYLLPILFSTESFSRESDCLRVCARNHFLSLEYCSPTATQTKQKTSSLCNEDRDTFVYTHNN
jgi:hypothetical protein